MSYLQLWPDELDSKSISGPSDTDPDPDGTASEIIASQCSVDKEVP